MKHIIIFIFLAILLFVGSAEARQVTFGINWFYEVSNLPTGMTLDQAYANTSKVILYKADSGSGPWIKVAEWPMSSFTLPVPVGGFPISANIDLADGNLYTIYFYMSEVNVIGFESPKSNIISISIDLRLPPPPTIKMMTTTVIVP